MAAGVAVTGVVDGGDAAGAPGGDAAECRPAGVSGVSEVSEGSAACDRRFGGSTRGGGECVRAGGSGSAGAPRRGGVSHGPGYCSRSPSSRSEPTGNSHP
ncbi:hypothetical protein Acy02nite_69530 [Actinoplanes cyaneus]|uniref:Uncharacterized protein n=1 Tax=Actinoplanes cyaneus TaxID=52696 RepID=A0A919IPP0_9ACTN|nr:hypothetical protein Acy02nite_69530 [Actinoplanes cyaneus]